MGGMIALPAVVSQIPQKNLCFSITKATDRQHVNPDSLVLALTRLRDFLVVERGVTSLSLLVYGLNSGKITFNIFGNGHRGLLAQKVLSEHMLELYLALIVLIGLNFQVLRLGFRIIFRYQVFV